MNLRQATSMLFLLPSYKLLKKQKYVQSMFYGLLTLTSILFHSKSKMSTKYIEVIDKSLAHTLLGLYTTLGFQKQLYTPSINSSIAGVLYYINKSYLKKDNMQCLVHIMSIMSMLKYIENIK